jgi:hypothetical protein
LRDTGRQFSGSDRLHNHKETQKARVVVAKSCAFVPLVAKVFRFYSLRS